jgi:glycosyltransferase involved in cell wall biosynthesis
MAISFIRSCYSKQASSPTKIAEYLACGLPIISNTGIGDLDQQITDDKVGVLIDRFDPEAYADAIQRLRALGDTADRCRDAAKRRFDLETVGGARYRRLYKNLLQS